MVVHMRSTSSHAKDRRSHHALSGERVTKDAKTGAVHPRHRALLDGTQYRGRTVMDRTSKKVPAAQKAAAAAAVKQGAARKGRKKADAAPDASAEKNADS